MATATKVTRVANPRRKRNYRSRARARSRANPRMVRNRRGQFVKKARAKRRTRVTNRRVRRAVNHRRPAPRRRRTTNVHRRRKRNPVLIELGAINPFHGATKKRRKSMATRKRRKARNPRRRRHVTAVAPVRRRRRRNSAKRTYRRRRRNPVTAVVHHRRRRRRNAVSHRRRSYRRRRNPMFGVSGGKDMLTMVGGGLAGVALTKFLPTLIPSSITANFGASPLVGVAMTVAGAFAASFLARKIMPGTFADAVLFGGLMQAGSVALTAFAPAALSQQLALSGMGDIVPGWFAVPQNSVTNRAPLTMMPSPAGAGGGMGAAIPRPFGRR